MTALDPLSFKGALFSALPSVLVPTPDHRRLTSLDFESLEQSCFPSRRTAQQNPNKREEEEISELAFRSSAVFGPTNRQIVGFKLLSAHLR